MYRDISKRDRWNGGANRAPSTFARRVVRLEIRSSTLRFDSNRPPAQHCQSPRAAALVRVALPPIVRDAAREARRDSVSRRRNSARAPTPDRFVPWGVVETRGGRSRSQSRSDVARGYARELSENVREVQVWVSSMTSARPCQSLAASRRSTVRRRRRLNIRPSRSHARRFRACAPLRSRALRRRVRYIDKIRARGRPWHGAFMPEE